MRYCQWIGFLGNIFFNRKQNFPSFPLNIWILGLSGFNFPVKTNTLKLNWLDLDWSHGSQRRRGSPDLRRGVFSWWIAGWGVKNSRLRSMGTWGAPSHVGQLYIYICNIYIYLGTWVILSLYLAICRLFVFGVLGASLWLGPQDE